jgi:hypothetical protein
MALAQLPAAIEAAARLVRNDSPSIAENVRVTVAARPAATGIRSPAISGQEFYPVCRAATPNDFA